MHPRKNVISRVEDGIRFLGLQIWKDRCRLPRPWRVKLRRKMHEMAASYRSREVDWHYVVQHIAAWRGHAFWPGAQHWLKSVMEDCDFQDFLVRRAFS